MIDRRANKLPRTESEDSMAIYYDVKQRALVDEERGWTLTSSGTSRDAVSKMHMKHTNGETVDFSVGWLTPDQLQDSETDVGRVVTSVIHLRRGETISKKTLHHMNEDAEERAQIFALIREYLTAFIRYRTMKPEAKIEIVTPTIAPRN